MDKLKFDNRGRSFQEEKKLVPLELPGTVRRLGERNRQFGHGSFQSLVLDDEEKYMKEVHQI